MLSAPSQKSSLAFKRIADLEAQLAPSIGPPVCRGQKWALRSSSSRARSLSLG
jgi:hypothetical protein